MMVLSVKISLKMSSVSLTFLSSWTNRLILPFVECYLPRAEFERINIQRQENGEAEFANPRNAAAGTLRQLDTKVVAERRLATFLYQEASPTERLTQNDVLNEVAELGFSVNPRRIVTSSMDEFGTLFKLLDRIAMTWLMILMVLLSKSIVWLSQKS